MAKFNKLKSISEKRNAETVDVIVPKVQNEIVTKIDYAKFNLDDETVFYLKEREVILNHSSKQISKNLAEQSKAFYEAQQMLSERQGGDGTFIEWYTELGFSRQYVYRAVNAYSMFLSYNSEKIFELPVRVREELYKRKDELEEAEVIEIISDEKPQNKLKEIEKAKTEKEELEKYKDIDNDLDKYQLELKEQKNLIYDKKIELEKVKEQYDKLKKELQELKETEKELMVKIKISKQTI